MIGMQLWHVRGGCCVVRQPPTGSPPRVVVDFVKGAKGRPVLWSELRIDRDSKAEIRLPESPTLRPPTGTSSTPSWTEARQAIFALRLGQVTARVAQLITVGTEEIEATAGNVVERAEGRQPTFLVVEGPWGTGKTHALALLRAIAVRRKMAVAQLVLDGVGTTLSRPNDLLREIVRGAVFPSETGGDDLLEMVADFARDQRTNLLRDNGLSVLADALGSIPQEATNDPEALELIESYLSGEISAHALRKELSKSYDNTTNLVSLRATRRDEQPQRFATLLAEWARACRSLPSHGLVVILDEVDVELAFARSARDVEQRNRVLEELASISDQPTPLAVVFAIAPGASVAGFDSPTDYLVKQLGASCVTARIPELNPTNLVALAANVVRLYEQAFPGSPIPDAREWRTVALEMIESAANSPAGIIPRRFIRSFMEYLDAESFARTT